MVYRQKLPTGLDGWYTCGGQASHLVVYNIVGEAGRDDLERLCLCITASVIWQAGDCHGGETAGHILQLTFMYHILPVVQGRVSP